MKRVKKLYHNMSAPGVAKKRGKSGKPASSNGSSIDVDYCVDTSGLDSALGIPFEDNLCEDNENTSEDLYCELPYESSSFTTLAGDSGFNEADQAKINAWRETMIPPSLPGNHPFQHKLPIVDNDENIYLDAVDFKKNIEPPVVDMVQQSTQEISIWGIDDVMKCLEDLKLQKHTKSFEDSLVDGNLLLDLDEDVLRDLGLSLFEARKLRKFVLGWRPGKMRPEMYPKLKGYSSNDPLDWNIQDTVSHMLYIDIRDMAEFCEQNQVDGELLKDICEDETIMGSIIQSRDRKLKMVKMKNYIIDQWRPRKKRDSYVAYESVSCDDAANEVPQPSRTYNVSQHGTGTLYIQNKTQRNPNAVIKNNPGDDIVTMPRAEALGGGTVKMLPVGVSLVERAKKQLEENISNWESRKK